MKLFHFNPDRRSQSPDRGIYPGFHSFIHSIADWQFCQAANAARILACDVLAIPWASAFNWQSLTDHARSLEPEHRTLAREVPIQE